jgi:DNA-binding NtrC family response regulator
MKRVLVVDDDAVSCEVLSEVLGEEGLTVVCETNPRKALASVDKGSIDLAILDVRMPEMNGLELLQRLRERIPSLPVIIMTGFGSVETAVDAITSGAVDYVSKPMNVDEIRAAVDRALRGDRAPRADLPVESEVIGDMVGRTRAMVTVYKTIARVAPGRSTVLILGESGTGKELVARAVHRYSPRRNKPFVAVDCGALTETLLESELFGHVRGAFTGAEADKPGLLVEADGGTILLDEIGDITAALQAKLLRVLEEQRIRPVGGVKWRSVDVRILAATNRDLATAVQAGHFREDLFYRLNVVTIRIPPLRERRSDLPLLVDHLIRRAAAENRKPVTGMSAAALELLQKYRWPGNIRELAHVIERGVVMSRSDLIEVDDLPLEIRAPASEAPTDLLEDRPTLEELKKRYIQQVLTENQGNMTRTAAVLGVDRRSLYRMLERYEIPHTSEPQTS